MFRSGTMTEGLQFPDNRRLTVIAAVGALCCCACAVWIPKTADEERFQTDASDSAGQLASVQLNRLQHENRRLRNRVRQAQANQKSRSSGQDLPTFVAVPDEWLRAKNGYSDPLVPGISSHWRSLFSLTDEQWQQLNDVFAEAVDQIHSFEAAHASTVTDADGSVRIRVEPFDTAGPNVEWHFFDEIQESVANVVGEEKARFLSKPFSRTTYSRHSNEAMELSFELRNEALILVQKTKDGQHRESAFEIYVQHKSERIFARYGHLLAVDSAEGLQQLFDSIATSASSQK